MELLNFLDCLAEKFELKGDNLSSKPCSHFPLKCALSMVSFPSPCRIPCLNCPSQRQLLPHKYCPQPSFSPCTKSPVYSETAIQFSSSRICLPFPQRYPFFQFPYHLFALVLKVPCPFILLFSKFPQYLLPSWQISSPFPCFCPFRNSPLQRLARSMNSSPKPVGNPSAQVPVNLQMSPVSCLRRRTPLPFLFPAATLPSKYDPSGQRKKHPDPDGPNQLISPQQSPLYFVRAKHLPPN